jgi:uncharacterized membrane protein
VACTGAYYNAYGCHGGFSSVAQIERAGISALTENKKNKKHGEDALQKLFSLFVIGFLTIFVGVVILFVATVFSGGSADVGGVIFIWFIPIVFGAGPNSTWIILFALVLAVLSIVIFLISYRRR